MDRINITDALVQKWLANGTLVHIHGNKYTKYKNEIMQSIFVIEMSPEEVSTNLMKMELKNRSIVVVKSVRHEKDRSDKRIANKVIVGRLIRTVIEGRRQGADFHLPRLGRD